MSRDTKIIAGFGAAILVVLLVVSIFGSDDEDQTAAWRGLSDVLRLLTMIGRAF